MNVEQKRLWVLTGIVFSALAIIGILFYSFTSDDSRDEHEISNIILDDSDVQEIKELSLDFSNKATNFGLNVEKITPENIYSVESNLDNSNMKTRTKVFEEIKPLLNTQGPLINDNLNYSTWEDTSLDNWRMIGYSGDEYKVNDVSNAYQDLETDQIFAWVKMSFNSSIVSYVPTGSDIDWDGSYEKHSRKNTLIEYELQVIKENDVWSIYDIRTSSKYLFSITQMTNDYMIDMESRLSLEETIQSIEIKEIIEAMEE